MRASGAGTIVLACFGALDIWDLAPGETFTLDTNHMVAYEETVSYKLHRAVEGRSIQSFKSGRAGSSSSPVLVASTARRARRSRSSAGSRAR